MQTTLSLFTSDAVVFAKVVKVVPVVQGVLSAWRMHPVYSLWLISPARIVSTRAGDISQVH